MEYNRDRCIKIALSSINSGQYEKAEKFLRKAENLFPSLKAKELLKHVKEMAATDTTNKGENVRKRTAKDANNSNTDYSQKEIETVRKINNSKNHYDVLGIRERATDTEIRKAYMKLVLQLHPDKNHAPGAEEAFQTMSQAYKVLTDTSSREEYDLSLGPSTYTYYNLREGWDNDQSCEYSNLEEDWQQEFKNESSQRSFFSTYGVKGTNVVLLACVCVSIAIFYVSIYLLYSESFLKQKSNKR